MKINSWTLVVIILVWLISGFAGISFLLQAFRDNPGKIANSWWRKYLHGVRLRFLYLMGILLIAWVVVGVFWVWINYRTF